MDLKERELITRVLAGETTAFEPLVRPYRGPLLGLAVRLTGNREDALEIIQEALLRAFRYLGRCDPERGFRNWLYGILVNAARDHGNRKSREASWRSDGPFPENAAAAGPGPEEARDRSEFRSRLAAALCVLSPKEKEIFVLRDLEDRSVGETSEIVRSSALAVRVHLSRARKKLRAELGSAGPGIVEGSS